MSKPFFEMHNRHIGACGNPPRVSNADSGNYFGYFENEHGEQWVFTYDRKSETGELCGGDVGWENAHQVRNGKVVELILNAEERKWLQACWEAATAFNRFK